VSLPAGRAEAPTHTDALTSIENVEGGDGGDTLIGNAGRNRLTGEGGKDELRGNAGDDRLVGDGGGLFVGGGGRDDTMVGGPGNDLLLGERGDDRMFGRLGDDRLIAGRGRDDVFGGTGNDRLNSRDGRRDAVRIVADRVKVPGFWLKTYAYDDGTEAGTDTSAGYVSMDGNATMYITGINLGCPDFEAIADEPPASIVAWLLALSGAQIDFLGATSDVQVWSNFREQVWGDPHHPIGRGPRAGDP
jgi:hypothetical protein